MCKKQHSLSLCYHFLIYVFFVYIRSILVVTKYTLLNDFLLMC